MNNDKVVARIEENLTEEINKAIDGEDEYWIEMMIEFIIQSYDYEQFLKLKPAQSPKGEVLRTIAKDYCRDFDTKLNKQIIDFVNKAIKTIKDFADN